MMRVKVTSRSISDASSYRLASSDASRHPFSHEISFNCLETCRCFLFTLPVGQYWLFNRVWPENRANARLLFMQAFHFHNDSINFHFKPNRKFVGIQRYSKPTHPSNALSSGLLCKSSYSFVYTSILYIPLVFHLDPYTNRTQFVTQFWPDFL